MKDQALRDMLEKGGVIVQKGPSYTDDKCKDFSNLWRLAFENDRRIDLLLEHLGLKISTHARIEKIDPA